MRQQDRACSYASDVSRATQPALAVPQCHPPLLPKAQSAQISRVPPPPRVYFSSPHPSGHLGQDRGDVDELGEAELRRRVGFQGRDDFVHRELGHVDAGELQEAEEVGADDEARLLGVELRATSSAPPVPTGQRP